MSRGDLDLGVHQCDEDNREPELHLGDLEAMGDGGRAEEWGGGDAGQSGGLSLDSSGSLGQTSGDF